jgi:protein-S-isoprenylcysteine O-methyltransferase Ste14
VDRRALALLAGAINAVVVIAPAGAVGRLGAFAADPGGRVFVALAAAFCACEVLLTRHERGGGSAGGGRQALASGLALLAVFWAAVLDRAHAGPAALGVLRVAGGAAMAGGIALRLAAIRALGASFVSDVGVDAARPLVSSGPYARLRHPSETGLLLLALGACALVASAPAAIVWLACLVPLSLRRIGLEESQLARAFAGDWRAYAAATPRLIPWRVRKSNQ